MQPNPKTEKMENRILMKHEESENSSYGFNLLNDRQRAAICGQFDFIHSSIDKDLDGGNVLDRNGVLWQFELTPIGIKNIAKF